MLEAVKDEFEYKTEMESIQRTSKCALMEGSKQGNELQTVSYFSMLMR